MESELTYKGPKIDPTTKTRVEYSTGILDFEKARAIFLSLGFSDVATVTKERTYCEFDHITLSIDDVEELGTFTELELVVEGEGAVEAARSRVLTLVEELGLDISASVRESYLEILLAQRGVR